MVSQMYLRTASAVLLLLSCLHMTKADAPNQLEFLSQVAKDINVLGKTALCHSVHGNDAEILSKAYKVYDTTVNGIKTSVDGPLTEEKFGTLLKILVHDTSAAAKVVDPACSNAANYCPESDPPPQAATMAALGKALITLGSTFECLTANPNPEHLATVPVIIGNAIQKVANHKGDSITSVGIILPEIIEIAVGFQSLSTTCANVAQPC
ncbi:uncharacterized protein LOC106082884 [Stomoxys calcitrans]|uniref:uncharacterized protein LOC106082884 n=1 Tax=Stomoxys calcitrans TaxID=35570 RepID=UPI0027E231C2|nr:uncharacterized protein LOC106082884 [Stomoxys calcitrans]